MLFNAYWLGAQNGPEILLLEAQGFSYKTPSPYAVMDIMVEKNTDLTNIYDYTGV